MKNSEYIHGEGTNIDYSKCLICNTQKVIIEGRRKESDNREICPNCLQKRMDKIELLATGNFLVNNININYD